MDELSRSLTPAEIAIHEHVERVLAGDTPDLEALRRRWPDAVEEIQGLERLLALLGAVRRDAADRGPSTSVYGRLERTCGSNVDPNVRLGSGDEARPSEPTGELIARLAEQGFKGTRYQIVDEVGRGGMGVVLRVIDGDLRRVLAMKVMLDERRKGASESADRRRVVRFLEEAQITGQLDHPGIVPVHELGLSARERVYFTMRLVRGRSLKEIFRLVREEREGWNTTRALGVIQKVCEATAYAHSRGVIHRDLKPANVMVGDFGEAYVMDWGVARVLGQEDRHDLRVRAVEGEEAAHVATDRADERDQTPDSSVVTLDGEVVGTPVYMSPEQARSEIERVGPRSDVYSVGAMLYELLVGRPPHVEAGEKVPNHVVLARVMVRSPRHVHELAPHVPVELAAICSRAMAHEPDQRYADMSALAEDVRAFLEQRVVKAYRTGAWAEMRMWVSRNRGLAGAIAAAVLLLVVGLTTSLVFKARADANAGLANARGAEAAEQARIATQRADDVLSLSAIRDLADLEARADELWPAHPRRLADFDAWLADARVLIDGRAADPARGIKAKPSLDEHEAKLAALRSRAKPRTEAARLAEREAHSRFAELRALEARRSWMARMLGDEAWPNEREIESELSTGSLPAAPAALNELAWTLVDPERRVYGGEMRASILARRAVSGAPGSERGAFRDTLAWALLWVGRASDALAEARTNLEEAPPEKKQEYGGYLVALEKEAARWQGIALDDRRGKQTALAREIDALDREVDERRAFDFESTEERWWNAELEKLIADLEAFNDPERGAGSRGISERHGWGIAKRREFAESLAERTIDGADARARWREAIDSIADPSLCPQYGGLRIEPWIGLVPVGRDSKSGLWEFAHVQSGSVPERGADRELVNKEDTGLVLVLVPGGRFTMGAQGRDATQPSFDALARKDESPVHEIELAPFLLSKYEMTQAQWLRCTGRNPSQYVPGRVPGDDGATLRRPLEQVSWLDCQRVLVQLDLQVPSEAQWEYAARAGSLTPWWTGSAASSMQGAANLADAFFKANGGPPSWPYEAEIDDGSATPAPVGTYRANAFGLHDVHGNVWEWCRDGYAAYSNPVRPGDAEREVNDARERVVRGGGWDDVADRTRVSNRGRFDAALAVGNLGVRPARSLR